MARTPARPEGATFGAVGKDLPAAPSFLGGCLSGGPDACGLADQVVALGYVRGPAGGFRVGRARGRQVALELVEVRADGMPPVAVAEHLAQRFGLAQAGGGSADVADRDRPAEHRGGILTHRVVAESDEVVVPGED